MLSASFSARHQFHQYKFTHYCMQDIDCKTLDRIYAFTSGLTTNCSSLQYHCDIEKKKKI